MLATAVLAIGLGAGGALLVGTISAALLSTVDSEARQTATAVAGQVSDGRVADPIPLAGGAQLVQVVDAKQRVRAASVTAPRDKPVLTADEIAKVAGGQALLVDGQRSGIGTAVRFVGVSAGPPADRRTVLVGAGVGEVLKGQEAVRGAVLIGCPVLLVGLAVLTWLVVGATLRPVAALRAGAAEITGTGSTRRLPVPDADDEMHRLAVTLNDMLSRLEAANDRQRAFVADAAHELRSPLTSLRTQLELAGRRWPDERTDDLLAETERLSRLVDDLLLLARLDADNGPPAASRDVDVAELARMIGRRYADADVPVEVSTDPVAIVRGDRDRLARVLANLLDNAVRHAASRVDVSVRAVTEPAATVDRKPGRNSAEKSATGRTGRPSGGKSGQPKSGSAKSGSVKAGPTKSGSVKAGSVKSSPVKAGSGRSGGHEDSASVIISVVDDGPGIRVADRDRVFERFTRLDDARDRDSGGVGLGLAIVADLVRAHGGTVSLTDAASPADDSNGSDSDGSDSDGLGSDRSGSDGLRVTVRLPLADAGVHNTDTLNPRG